MWGGLHGVYLMVNHAWVAVAARIPALAAFRRSRAGAGFGWALTFVAVVVAWVFFRAPDFATAIALLKGMAGLNGLALPAGLAFALRPFHGLTAVLGITFVGSSGGEFAKSILWIAAALALALFAPNTQELMRNYAPVLDMPDAPQLAAAARDRRALTVAPWFPSPAWAAATAALAFFGTISITRVSEFLYWQF